jgi:hypothetical protein
MAIMVLGLIMNLVSDPQRSAREKLVTRPTLSQYPLMIGHMEKAIREIPHHLTTITLLMADTIKTKLLPAIRPTCHHQSIRHSRSLREELSYVETKARGDKAMTLAREMSLHDGKQVEIADPSKENKLNMTTGRTAAATRINIALLAATMTKGRAPTAMMTKGRALAAMMRTRKIQLHDEQREVIAVAEIHCRMSRARGVTPHHPHQAAPMVAAVAVAAQPGHAAPEKICRITSPTMRAPT